jgi:hypothetical protein
MLTVIVGIVDKDKIIRKYAKKFDICILEPECGLSPEFQVEYIKNLEIPKDIMILITTQSPYILKAIEKYIEPNVKDCEYILETAIGVNHITGNLNSVYKMYYDPMEQLF